MIAGMIILTAMIVFLMLATQMLYRARMDARLEFIDELVKRGFDISALTDKDGYSD